MLTAETINTDVLFIGDRKLAMGPAGELIIDGSVNILGDVTITGDVNIDGAVLADSVRTKSIEIDIPEPDPVTNKSNASIGTDTLPSGQTEIMIETSAIKDDSKVFITPSTATDKVLSVTETIDGDYFKVVVTSPSPTDIEFDWWIVQVAAASSP